MNRILKNTLKILDYTFKNKELLYNKNKINFENNLKKILQWQFWKPLSTSPNLN